MDLTFNIPRQIHQVYIFDVVEDFLTKSVETPIDMDKLDRLIVALLRKDQKTFLPFTQDFAEIVATVLNRGTTQSYPQAMLYAKKRVSKMQNFEMFSNNEFLWIMPQKVFQREPSVGVLEGFMLDAVVGAMAGKPIPLHEMIDFELHDDTKAVMIKTLVDIGHVMKF